MTTVKSQARVYGLATFVALLLIWPFLRFTDSGKSYLVQLMFHFPFMLLGAKGLELSKVKFNLIVDLIAIAINPGFIAGLIVGWNSVRDMPSTAKGLIPVGMSIGVLFVIGFALSTASGGGGDMGGLWVMGPIAATVFFPFAWLGAIAGWKGAEAYARVKGNPNHSLDRPAAR